MSFAHEFVQLLMEIFTPIFVDWSIWREFRIRNLKVTASSNLIFNFLFLSFLHFVFHLQFSASGGEKLSKRWISRHETRSLGPGSGSWYRCLLSKDFTGVFCGHRRLESRIVVPVSTHDSSRLSGDVHRILAF